VTTTEYATLSNKIERFNLWLGNRCSYRPEEVPADLQIPTNEERSKIEVADFNREQPDKYFLYIDAKKRIATTFTGELLGVVTFGREYECPGFYRPSTRVPVRIQAINGCEYFGTYFKSSGDFARIKKCK
jgi:hypothetical protein